MVITEVDAFVTLVVIIKLLMPMPPHCRNQTALMYAAFYGHIDVAKLLVNSNADVWARNV
jgi:hypothetical protein